MQWADTHTGSGRRRDDSEYQTIERTLCARNFSFLEYRDPGRIP